MTDVKTGSIRGLKIETILDCIKQNFRQPTAQVYITYDCNYSGSVAYLVMEWY